MTAHAQIFQRELGDFDLKLGTTPAAAWLKGWSNVSGCLVSGGLDLTHNSGLYWPVVAEHGITPGKNLEIDSYVGFKQPSTRPSANEIGMIITATQVDTLDSQELFGGLTLLGSRSALHSATTRINRTARCFADPAGKQPFGIGLSMKYTTHEHHHTVSVDGGYFSSFPIVGEIFPCPSWSSISPDLQQFEPQRQRLLGLLRA